MFGHCAITRICDDLGLAHCSVRAAGAAPGTSNSSKVDGRKCFQYTALDGCTWLRVLRLYPRLNRFSSLDFLGSASAGFPSGGSLAGDLNPTPRTPPGPRVRPSGRASRV
jgi:hypothetical protein